MASASSRRNSEPSSHWGGHKQSGKSSNTVVDGRSVTKRLQQDLMTLMMSGDQDISAFPINDNMFTWAATIVGGKETNYDGLSYKLSFVFSEKYPYEAPTVTFETPCYHPNVDDKGNICLDTLKEKWSALLDVRTILLSIQSLLAEPNPDSPLNGEAARLWENQKDYKVAVLAHYNKQVSSEN